MEFYEPATISGNYTIWDGRLASIKKQNGKARGKLDFDNCRLSPFVERGEHDEGLSLLSSKNRDAAPIFT